MLKSLLRMKEECKKCQKKRTKGKSLKQHMKGVHEQDRTCFPPNLVLPPGGSLTLELLDAANSPEIGSSAGGCIGWEQALVGWGRLREMVMVVVVEVNGPYRGIKDGDDANNEKSKVTTVEVEANHVDPLEVEDDIKKVQEISTKELAARTNDNNKEGPKDISVEVETSVEAEEYSITKFSKRMLVVRMHGQEEDDEIKKGYTDITADVGKLIVRIHVDLKDTAEVMVAVRMYNEVPNITMEVKAIKDGLIVN